MFQPLSIFVGLRYTRAKRRNHFISFIALASMLGIALGVAAIIVVLSVMNGFQTEIRNRVLSMVAHATVNGMAGPLVDWRNAMDEAKKMPEVIGSAPYIEREGLLQGSATSGAFVRGVLPELESQVSEIAAQMKQGSLNDLVAGEFKVVLGQELAYKLGVELGDKVTIFAPTINATPAGVLPQTKRFTVVGIFAVGMFEYDSGWALVHMQDAQKLYRMGSGVTGVQLKLKDMYGAFGVARDLARKLNDDFLVSDWTRKHGNLFKAVRTEKIMMFLILSLIMAVAAFNLVSTLVMVVTDKQADIAILRTLGSSPAQIMRIFMVLGSLIGWFGTLLGVLGGLLLAFNVERLVGALERVFGFEAMPADVYYISSLPSEINAEDVALVALVSVIFSLLATLYPAWRAARTQPAEALRYE